MPESITEERLSAFEKSFRVRRRRRRVLIILAAAVLSALVLTFIALSRLRPLTESAVRSEISSLLSASVGKTLSDMAAAGELEYGRLVTTEKDENGRICALSSDMELINSLKTRVISDANTALCSCRVCNAEIPLGSLLYGNFISGRGPSVTVRVPVSGSADAELVNEFSSVGINQTRHRIAIEVTALVTALYPGGAKEEAVKTDIPVAETVIVGEVPEAYLR